jgi:hypothetical protein
MTKRLLTLIVAATLAACTTTQRQGPPAPVVTAGEPRPAPVEAAPPPPSPPKRATPRPVEVYAYRPPSEAARIPEEVEPAPEPMDAAEPGVEPGSDSEIVAPDVLPPNVAPVVAAAPPPKVPAPSPAAPPAPEVAAAQSTSGGAARPADALRIQADQQRQAGDYAGAAATLERALRIQPQDALLWNRLARVRMEQGLHSQAANLAAKSNVYAGDQAGLRQDNWSIIATARRQAGDAAGAEEAERKARGA